MSRVVGGFLTLILASAIASAQIPQPPPGFPGAPARDTAPAPTGTASIRGHVFDASNGRPLRKVNVRAFAPELRENRVAVTDNNGAYELKNLPAGRYQMTANKGSFVTLQYGQTRPFEQGKPLEVRNAQQLDKIDFSLPRGAIVTGRIIDEAGEPTSNVQVSVQRYQYVNGRRQLSISGIATTNDIGEYRLFGIAPGQYYVTATLRFGNGGPLGEVSDDRSGYAPTYFPGTTNVNDAQRITLGLAQQMNDVNIALSPTKLARVSGTAVDSLGKPATNGVLMMMQTGGGGLISTAGGAIKPDGSFVINGVAPGEYTLRVMTPVGPLTSPSLESIQATVTVAGDDITDLRLIGQKPSVVNGRVIAPAGVTDLNFSLLQLQAVPKDPVPLLGSGGGRVSEDGTFELLVPAGAAFIRMTPNGPFANTRIKAVRLNGVDVVDTGIDFKPNENVNGLEVELTNQLSSLSGAVTDARGNTARDYTVITFARDREHWGPGTRYIQSGRPDQDGRYKVSNLPPGEYFAIALDYVEQGAQTDPDFLERVKEKATAFSMNEAEIKTLDLRLVTGM